MDDKQHEQQQRISEAVFIISVKAGDRSLPLYVTEGDVGREADIAGQFIRDNGLPQFILNDLTGTIKDRLESYFRRKESALFFLDFTTPDGTKTIFVNADDDIEQLATDFVDKHDLPRTAINKLQAIIKEKKDLLLKQQEQYNINNYINSDHHDIKENDNQKIHKKTYDRKHDSKKNDNIDNNKPKAALSIDTSSKNDHQPAASRLTRAVFTPTFVSSFKDNNSRSSGDVIKRADASSTNIDTSESKDPMPPVCDNVFERLHSNALSLKKSQEQLKIKLENDRRMSIQSTSFKSSIGHMRNSPSTRRRSRSVDSLTRGRRVVDNDGILNRRPLSVCRAIRTEHEQQYPPTVIHNQETFDRLYDTAHHQEVTKQALKLFTEMERRKSIECTTFKSSIGHVPNSPSNKVPKSELSVFERLNKDAEKKVDYLEMVKEMVEEDRRLALQSTTFRESIGFAAYSPSLKVSNAQIVDGSFHENLYQRDMQWLYRRNKSLADLGNEIRKKKSDEELREIKDKPELFTSPHTHRPNSVSKDRLFASLYEYADVQREQQSRLSLSYEMERVKELGSPMLVAPKSIMMARKVQSERIDRKLNSSIYKDDYSSPFINNDNLVTADFTSPFGLDRLDDGILQGMAEAVEATQDNKFVNPNSNNSSPTVTTHSKEADQVSNLTSGSSKMTSGSRKKKQQGAFSFKSSTIWSPSIVDGDNIIFGESPILESGALQQTPNNHGILGTVDSEGSRHDNFRKSIESNKSNASTVTIFDQLYEERHVSAEKHQMTIKKYKPTFNFSPVLETNNHINNKIEDGKRREITKEAFYQKMYNYRLKHEKMMNENVGKTIEQEMSKNVSHGVVLDKVDKKNLIDRLTAFYPDRHNKEIDRMKEQNKQSFENLTASKKSDEIAKKARRNSLNKIFDTLLLSVDMVLESKGIKKLKAANSSSLNETNEEKNNRLLDVKHAVPEALECPPNLSDALGKVLTSAKDFLSREQFIEKIESLIKSGVIAPFSAALSAPNKAKVVESSEDIQARYCKEKPVLVAKKTDVLASQKRPLPGQALEDHLHSYDDLYERNTSKLREDLECEETKACTFQPILYSKYSYKGQVKDYSPQKISNHTPI